MIRQAQFEASHQAFWAEFEVLLAHSDRADRDLPQAYRRLATHLATAKSRHYSPDLVDRLQALAMRGHQQLYVGQTPAGARIVNYFWRDFPRAVRAQWPLLAMASFAFFGTAIIMCLATLAKPELVYTVLDGAQAEAMVEMYQPENAELGRESSASDALMFGFYIRNNTSIGLRTVAGGLLAGVGTLFFLVFNGVYFGAIFAHMAHAELLNATFLPFVSGHSAMELMAIALSGMAGLMLGRALLFPGRLTRLAALRQAAGQAFFIVWGIIVMFLLAACIEAFWSATTSIPKMGKYAFGISQWALVLGYLAFAGRSDWKTA